MTVSSLEFHENRRSEIHIFLTRVIKLYLIFSIYRPISIKFGMRDVHMTLFSVCEFRENSRTESVLINLHSRMYRETYNFLKTKNTLTNSAYYVTDYTICRLAAIMPKKSPINSHVLPKAKNGAAHAPYTGTSAQAAHCFTLVASSHSDCRHVNLVSFTSIK
jgi:hypothetical protein